MSCKLAAPYAVDFSQLSGSIGPADLPCEHLRAHRLQIFTHSLRTADILNDGSRLMSLVNEVVAQHCNHQVRRYEMSLFIHEHHAVSITVIDDARIRADFLHELLKSHHIFVYQRIRLMIRERAVHRVENIFRLIAENLLRVQ